MIDYKFINLFLTNKFQIFSDTEIENWCFLVREYNIETKSIIRLILYSSRSIRLQVFYTLAIQRRHFDIFFIGLTMSLITLFHRPSYFNFFN